MTYLQVQAELKRLRDIEKLPELQGFKCNQKKEILFAMYESLKGRAEVRTRPSNVRTFKSKTEETVYQAIAANGSKTFTNKDGNRTSNALTKLVDRGYIKMVEQNIIRFPVEKRPNGRKQTVMDATVYYTFKVA